ncbi:MAG: hypothetical protein PHQ59_05450 [Candidatus Daviesbacteria bacterium]|nr:hypothetical protein [Candidatus Daviesbacteria bacterium]
MSTIIEKNNATSLSHLSEGSSNELKVLWSNSCITKTEWIGVIVSTTNQTDLSIIPLGQQSESTVTTPAVDLYHRSQINRGSFDKKFVMEEIKIASQDLKQTSDDSGFCYQGKTLFLLPQKYMCDAISQVATNEGDLLITEEEFLGFAHTHPYRNKINHLPSLADLRSFVFGQLNEVLGCIISKNMVSVLAKPPESHYYFDRQKRHSYFQNQELLDAIKLEDQGYLSVLEDNCHKFGLQLLHGNIQKNLQLYPFFKN